MTRLLARLRVALNLRWRGRLGGTESLAVTVGHCLEPARVYAFADKQLGATARESVVRHIEDCDPCRVAVAEAVRQGRLASEPIESAEPVPAPRRTPSRGEIIHRYRVEKIIGSGAMGLVVLAEDIELTRHVVLKLIRPEVARPSGARARLLREAQAMAQLSHPNVVQIYDIGNHDSQIFLAMEYLARGNLREWLGRRKRSAAEIIAVFREAGRGLSAAHAAGIVHRDFKPANVVLSPSGKVKVTDFGLARSRPEGGWLSSPSRGTKPVSSHNALGAELTKPGAMLGTPAYMSPEQLNGEVAGAASDQYSFCVALYEALTGELPLMGGVDGDEFASRGRRPLGRADAALPARAKSVLRRGLTILPSDRFGSMDELLEALGDSPVRVGVGPRRVLLLVAAIGLLGLAILATVLAVSSAQVSSALPSATQLKTRADAIVFEQHIEMLMVRVSSAEAGEAAADAARTLEAAAVKGRELSPTAAAEAMLSASSGYEMLSDFAAAERALLEGLELARLGASDANLRARLTIRLAEIKRRDRRYAEAMRWADYAEDAVASAVDSLALRGRLAAVRAGVHADRGDPAAAEKFRLDAVIELEKGGDEERQSAALILHDVAMGLAGRGLADEALATLDRAEVLAGAERLDTRLPLGKARVFILEGAGRPDAAAAAGAALNRLIDEKAHTLGDGVTPAMVKQVVGGGAANTTLDEATRLVVVMQRASLLSERGEDRRAVAGMAEALRIATALYGAGNPMTMAVAGGLGSLESAAKRHSRAIARLLEVHGRAIEAFGDRDPLVSDLELRLCSAYQHAGQFDLALERARTVEDRLVASGMGPSRVGDAQWARAQALIAIAGESENAISLAQTARAALAGAFEHTTVKAIDTWLVEHSADPLLAGAR